MKASKAYVDLHIHSALSPCGDNDMTPGNIVGMAALNGLDIIAMTDHNIGFNAAAAVKIGERMGVTVIPGMELETVEEIHVVCLFCSVDALMEFQNIVLGSMTKIKNRTDIFGNEYIYDENDNIIGEFEDLLLVPSGFAIDDVFSTVEGLGGIAYPAHVDRDSYSVLTTLGALPESYKYGFVEISCECNIENLLEKFDFLKNYELIRASDAHYLDKIQEADTYLPLEDISATGVISFLKKKALH